MNSLRRVAACFAATATLATLSTVPAHADSLVLGNSRDSNTGFNAYAERGCKGGRDWVEVGELAKGIGAVGSIMVPANAGGFASPWYTITRKKSSWCWNAPTSAATSVYLKKVGAGSWTASTVDSTAPTKAELVAEASNFSNFK